MDEQGCEHRTGYGYVVLIVVEFLADQYNKYQGPDCPYFRLLYLAISGDSRGRNHARDAIRSKGSDFSSWYRKQSEGCLCELRQMPAVCHNRMREFCIQLRSSLRN
jgi:hypothetical protein